MRKLKEVLRLESLGLSQHQIARSCSISQSTVHEYVSAAGAAGVKWPLPENWDDRQIEQALFPQRPAPTVWRKHPEPDWPPILEELQTHRDLTLALIWQERRESDPEGYGYSRFCDLYRRWLNKRDLVLRHEHRAGEKMFVDYAGATIPINDRQTGAVREAAVFVAVQGASSYTFAEATAGQDLRNWIGSHIRAFEFFGGVAEVVVPDNLKSAVTHPSYYEPDLNPTYRDLAEHYGIAIIPARPYRPREKAKAEVGVQVVQRWIIAAVRKRKFFSLDEANQAIAELLVRLNQRPFRKREGNRASLFAQHAVAIQFLRSMLLARVELALEEARRGTLEQIEPRDGGVDLLRRHAQSYRLQPRARWCSKLDLDGFRGAALRALRHRSAERHRHRLLDRLAGFQRVRPGQG